MIAEDKTFSKIKFDDLKGFESFENCKFSGCDFSNADFSGKIFIECVFEDCTLTDAKTVNTGWQSIKFKHCNLSRIDFNKSLDFLFEVNFEICTLDNAVFYKKKNKGAKFIDCSAMEVDFTEADLTNAVFGNCNLNRTVFDHTILTGTDFRTSYNFMIDPDNNVIKKARFSVHGLPGLLGKYDIRIEG